MPFIEVAADRKLYARCDAEDLERVAARSWRLHSRGYVESGSGNQKVLLHREILRLVPGDGLEGDHINHNPLDNRRRNLRIVTKAGNAQNLIPRKNCTSRHRGVCWDRREGKWRGYVNVGRVRRFHAYFDSEENAAEAVADVRRRLMPYTQEVI